MKNNANRALGGVRVANDSFISAAVMLFSQRGYFLSIMVAVRKSGSPFCYVYVSHMVHSSFVKFRKSDVRNEIVTLAKDFVAFRTLREKLSQLLGVNRNFYRSKYMDGYSIHHFAPLVFAVESLKRHNTSSW